MAKPIFKEYIQSQATLFPQRLDERIPVDAPVRLVNQIIDQLDISQLIAQYKGGGTTAYHPRMMLKVIIFAYLNNICSCRKIEDAFVDRISFLWLSGAQTPDHNTINNFRSKTLKNTVDEIFTQIIMLLVEMGYLSLEVLYVDGTKMESRANRYSFVWRKSVEKNKEKLLSKVHNILKQIEEGIAQDDLPPNNDPPKVINAEDLRKRIAEINRENLSKTDQKAVKEVENKHLPKLQEYEAKLDKLGERNSYSKTDPDATFMRMKDDHLKNGQLKPACNLQTGTENQFITHFDFFSNPGDFLTLIPFSNGFYERYHKMPEQMVGDAGYGSEENYEFMQNADIEAFVKYPGFHAEQKQKHRDDPFSPGNLFYNREQVFLFVRWDNEWKKRALPLAKVIADMLQT
jgi:transposase